ncbi:MAG TPA: SDR family oxidoreductase [Syntrophorhabdales bacterium]|nr:SDR family oxidoreductase [Syntrophorhabdales bacterium]
MKDMFRLDNKVAVVVGGAGGIGESCALALASRGAKVVVADLAAASEKLDAVVKKIASETGSEASAMTVDVTSEESTAKLAAQVVQKYGTVDVLVNAHGINLKVAAVDIPVAGWDNLFAVNVKGTMLTCKAFGKIFVEKKKGKIINLSSIRGIRGTDGGNAVYGATKGAVDMITRMLAAEWAPYGVNVNAIGPSVIMTDMIKKNVAPERLKMLLSKVPLGRFANVEEVSAVCVYLASSEADFVTGQIIYVDGGLTAVG